MTLPVLSILSLMLQAPDDDWYGLEIAQRAGLKSGTLYPALMRLEKAGWLDSYWEEGEPSELGRPRRRLYSFTEKGEIAARDARARVAWLTEPRRVRLRTAPGRGRA